MPIMGHGHDDPDKKRGITTSEQTVQPDRREKVLEERLCS